MSIWTYIKRYPLFVWRGSAGGLGYNTLIVAGPILLGRALDSLLALERDGWTAGATAALRHNLLLLVLATAAFQGLRTIKRYDFRRLSNRIGTDLQHDLLESALGWPMSRLDRERTGDLMSRAVGDAQVVADTLMTTITEVFDTLVLMVAYFVVLLVYAPGLTLLCSIPAPVTALAAHFAGGAVFRRATDARVAASRVNSHLQETLNGVRTLRLYGREADGRRRLEVLCEDQLRANLAATLLQSGLMPLYAAVASLGLVAVIGIGGQMVVVGTWSVGSFTAYLTMFLAMTTRTLMAARVLNRLHAGRAAWTRLAAKIGQRPEETAVESAAAIETGPMPAGIALTADDLGFSFPGDSRAALAGVSFSGRPGAFICVTGPVGCGKSALASVLTGLYPYKGSVTLDGRELSSLAPEQRRRLISYAGQEPFLFSDTVRQNIAFIPAGDDDQLFQAAISGAALVGDREAFTAGWDTVVGERGVQISGGQRQRIALARALYKGAPLIVLDDPFSAVDVGTERRMIAGLLAAAGGATVVLVSHRLTSFDRADEILLLHHGRVRARGTHAYLLEHDETYASIYRAQVWLEQKQT